MPKTLVPLISCHLITVLLTFALCTAVWLCSKCVTFCATFLATSIFNHVASCSSQKHYGSSWSKLIALTKHEMWGLNKTMYKLKKNYKHIYDFFRKHVVRPTFFYLFANDLELQPSSSFRSFPLPLILFGFLCSPPHEFHKSAFSSR